MLQKHLMPVKHSELNKLLLVGLVVSQSHKSLYVLWEIKSLWPHKQCMSAAPTELMSQRYCSRLRLHCCKTVLKCGEDSTAVNVLCTFALCHEFVLHTIKKIYINAYLLDFLI